MSVEYLCPGPVWVSNTNEGWYPSPVGFYSSRPVWAFWTGTIWNITVPGKTDEFCGTVSGVNFSDIPHMVDQYMREKQPEFDAPCFIWYEHL